MLRALPGTRLLLALSALACFASVGGALVAQHVYNMQPCPWCVLQRALFIAVGLLGTIGALVPTRLLREMLSGMIGLLSLAGGAAALYQNRVASQSASCDLTLADRIVSGLKLDASWPDVFEVRASCAEATANILGVPFELWSFALFALLLLGAVAVFVQRGR